ncbi:MAG: DinB family protein [Rhizobacter sp.]|nr:DinB family protein [Rhizobacter sp.]
MGLTLAGQLRIQAHANRLANQRLHSALARLAPAEFDAPRTGFFPSLAATLNHLLAVDEFYIGALHGGLELPARDDAFAHGRRTVAAPARQRRAADCLLRRARRGRL